MVSNYRARAEPLEYCTDRNFGFTTYCTWRRHQELAILWVAPVKILFDSEDDSSVPVGFFGELANQK